MVAVRRADARSRGSRQPPGTRLTVTGHGRAHDSAGPVRDRRSTIAYERFTITVNR